MMWRRPVISFEGQLLFADVGKAHAMLDCMLARTGEDASVPMTFLLRLPNGKASKEAAKDLLEGWVDGGATISVTIATGRSGPEIAISSASARLVLEPAELTSR